MELRLKTVCWLAGDNGFFLGKLGEDLISSRAPSTPNGLAHDRCEREAFGRTGRFSVEVCALVILITGGGGGSIPDRRRDVAHAGGDCKVKSHRCAAPPSWNIDISGSAGLGIRSNNAVFWDGTQVGARLQETWLFELRIETRAGREVIHVVSEMVVAFYNDV